MLVRIVKNYILNGDSDFFQQTPNYSGQWGNIQFTEEAVDCCDYLIVLQKPFNDIQVKCKEGNTWLINQEPPTSRNSYFTRSFKYFDKVFSYYNYPHQCLQSIQPVLPWFVRKSYDELSAITKSDLTHKRDDLVWITSNTKILPGHKKRMRFKSFIDDEIDYNLYGNGFNPIKDKFEGLFPFKYSLAIENHSCKDYWTEKISDSFLSWCLPFYWGASNIEAYFPEKSFIRIDIDRPKETIKVLKEAILKDEWSSRLDAIEEARNLILNEYQFFPFISKMVSEDAEHNKNKRVKEYFIPANPFPKYIKVYDQLNYYKNRIFGRFVE